MTREEKNEISKQKILTAAIEEFGEKDYSLASTNSICKKHNISKGLLFHHFKNKDEIFLACVSTCFNELVSYIKLHYITTDKNLEDNLNKYFEVRHDFFDNHPYYNHIFKIANLNAPKHLIDKITELKLPLIKLNKNILSNILDGLTLKDEFSKEELIKIILNYSDYLLANKNELTEDCLNQQMVTFIKILFYGAINSKED